MQTPWQLMWNSRARPGNQNENGEWVSSLGAVRPALGFTRCILCSVLEPSPPTPVVLRPSWASEGGGTGKCPAEWERVCSRSLVFSPLRAAMPLVSQGLNELGKTSRDH